MQQLYGKVLADLSGAAADCRSAISIYSQGHENMSVGVNKFLMNRSMSKFAVGSNLLYTATAEVRVLHR